MRIAGPLIIKVVDSAEDGGRELHLSFTRAFQELGAEERVAAFEGYIKDLERGAQATEADSRERQGILLILQIAQELLSSVRDDEIPLAETLVVEIEQTPTLFDLIQSSHSTTH